MHFLNLPLTLDYLRPPNSKKKVLFKLTAFLFKLTDFLKSTFFYLMEAQKHCANVLAHFSRFVLLKSTIHMKKKMGIWEVTHKT